MTETKPPRFNHLGSSIRDLVVLVIGIMLSFFLTQWGQNRADDKEEKRIISLLYADLQADTAQIHQNVKQLKRLKQNYDTILKYKDRADDISAMEMYSYLYQVINLVPFNPKQTAYQQFIYQERSQTVKNKEILSDVISLFNSEYAQLEDINQTHEDFLINRLAIKYFELLPPISSLKDFTDEKSVQIKAVVQDNEVLNMLQFDVILKLNLEQNYLKASQKAEQILGMIEQEYENADWLVKG
jgi:hypothetical protein